MANLTETETFDAGVFEIATSTPATGGPGGVANAQAQALANRTKWLKARVEEKAPLNNPSLTGNPTAPTQAVDNDSTRIATTAFVIAQASSSGTPSASGTAARGTSKRYAREDHAHPTDTTRAPLANPSLTGTVTVPAPAADTSAARRRDIGLEWIATNNLAGVTQFAVFALPAAYSAFIFDIANIAPVVSGQFFFQLSNDNAATWITTGNQYEMGSTSNRSPGFIANAQKSVYADLGFPVSSAGFYSGQLRITPAIAGLSPTFYQCQCNFRSSTPAWEGGLWTGVCSDTVRPTHLRLGFDATDMQAIGKIVLRGVRP